MRVKIVFDVAPDLEVANSIMTTEDIIDRLRNLTDVMIERGFCELKFTNMKIEEVNPRKTRSLKLVQ